jgi:hypothetical protein
MLDQVREARSISRADGQYRGLSAEGLEKGIGSALASVANLGRAPRGSRKKAEGREGRGV